MKFGTIPENPLCFNHKDYKQRSHVRGDGDCEKHGGFAFQDDTPKILCVSCAKEEKKCRICGNDLTQEEIDYQNTKHLFELWGNSSHWIDGLQSFFQNPIKFPVPKEDVDEFKRQLDCYRRSINHLEKMSLEFIE